MTDKQLAEIEARWAKATPGEWGWIIRGNSVQSHAVVCHDDAKSLMPQNICSGISPKTENAIAIANAPTDIQVLLAEVRKLQEKLEYEQTCHAEAVAEVERLNRMVDSACNLLTMDSMFSAEGWRKFLESEEGNNG